MMILALLLFVFCASAAGNGIVKRVMKDDEPWPKEGVTKYTHYLECDHRHNFPGDTSWTYTYDIHCIKNEGESDLILSINYDNNVFDNFVVTSCELEDVVNSVFPPKKKAVYPEGEADDVGRPIISYLKYKTEDGKCYARKYQYRNRRATAATRFTPEEIDCPGKEGWSKHGEVAQFENCRVPKLPLSKLVKAWIPSKPKDPKVKEIEPKHTPLLECSFDQFSHLYHLKCVKGDNDNEFLASVTYNDWGKIKVLDIFTVTSCKEEDIVYGIFTVKETTANPKKYPWIQKIWFSSENGDCYKRDYPKYSLYAPTEDPEKVPCPTFPDEWINPSWGFSGQWRECKGPMSISGRAKTQPENGHEHSGSETHPQKGSEHSGSDNHPQKGSERMARDAGSGIVKRVMKDDEPWPKEGVTKYTHYLECDHRHNFPGDTRWTYTYDIHCIKNEGESELILSINYDNNVFDNFVVTSCELQDVINSVFPPKQKAAYPAEEADSVGRPITSYLKYKTEDGKCYARKYQYRNRKATAATRFTPEEIDCPGKEGWSKHGEVSQFENCRVPKLPLAKLVKAWIPSKPNDPKVKEIEPKHTPLLECSFDQFSHLYHLKCVKGDNDNGFLASVTYNDWGQIQVLDIFTVSSCKEEDIVYGIFPVKETTANPKNYGTWIQKIWFSSENGDCYKREYPECDSSAPTVDPVKVPCPTFPDEWINPSWGFSGQWRECKGPMSISGRAKTQPENGHEHSGSETHPQKGSEHSGPETHPQKGSEHSGSEYQPQQV